MKQLFENNLINPTNCQVCGNDEAYFMPARKEGIINFTLNIKDIVPETLITSGLPLALKVDMVTMDGTTVIRDLGGFKDDWNSNSLVTADITDQRFDVFIPSPCGSLSVGDDPYPYRFESAVYQGVVGTFADITINSSGGSPERIIWRVGEPTQHPIYQLADDIYMVNSKYPVQVVNSGLVGILALFPPSWAELSEIPCHRYRFQFTFDGVDYEVFSVPFECPKDDDVITIENRNNEGFIDCCDTLQSESASQGLTPYIELRTNQRVNIYGYTKWLSPKIELEYAENCYHKKSTKTERIEANGRAMPYWTSEAISCIIGGKELIVEGIPYLFEGDSYLEDNDIDLTESKYLSLSLAQCKCEKTFIC